MLDGRTAAIGELAAADARDVLDANSDLVGLPFSEVGRRRNADPMDGALHLLQAEGEALDALMWTSRGFDHVLLGGTLTLRDGRRTSANPGHVVRAHR